MGNIGRLVNKQQEKEIMGKMPYNYEDQYKYTEKFSQMSQHNAEKKITLWIVYRIKKLLCREVTNL